MSSVFIKVTTDDFLQDQVLNERRIKAYKEIAKDYNVSESTIRDVFHLGINFAIANMEEIELPTDKHLDETDFVSKLQNRIKDLESLLEEYIYSIGEYTEEQIRFGDKVKYFLKSK